MSLILNGEWRTLASYMTQIAGQLSECERRMLSESILKVAKKPEKVIEVGTWLGGGSTLHILRALETNGNGHLWGVEADRSIYDQMLANINGAAPEVAHRFTPLFGISDHVLPEWIRDQGPGACVDFVFLDGGDRPGEQILEFELLDPLIPVGGQLMAHDAMMRKGKWLVPYVSLLDNWESRLHRDSSKVGMFYSRKTRPAPSPVSLKAARSKLRALKFSPIEVASAVLPSPVCGAILKMLPRGLVRRFYRGTK
jgi:predicted O-methyltransferase YrrM